MNKLFRSILMLVSIAALCFSGYQIIMIAREYAEGTDLYDDVAQQAVVSAAPSSRPVSSEAPSKPDVPAPEEVEPAEEAAPISVDFAPLLQQNQDVIGWIYCEGTPINYPVVQSDDNEYYLRRLLDGTRNDSGTIYMDYRNSADMSDRNTYIYGHNMKNESMFGTLLHYSDQSFYEEHPAIWYFTPEQAFRIEPIAAMVVDPDSDTYNMLAEDKESLDAHLEWLLPQSELQTGADLSSVERIVTLSTCAYDYEDARYVVVGNVVPVE